MDWFFYILAGVGAGVVTGLAGLSAAVVITPILVSLCGWPSYDAVTVALASDVLASLLSALTYAKNKNVDFVRAGLVGTTALAGAVVGSLAGYAFSQAQPDGLGYISMVATLFLGVKFLVRPISGGEQAMRGAGARAGKRRTALAMLLGIGIGFVCGFTGSGGGILMLTMFTLLMGYHLKIAVGTSTLIMSVIALTGAVSHFAMGAHADPVPMAVVVVFCTLAAWISARFANHCEIRKLNRVVGAVLILLGLITITVKLWW